MKVQEVMTGPVGIVSGVATVREAAEIMKETGASALAVHSGKGVQSGPYGIITDRDLALRVLAAGKGSATEVGEVCSLPMLTIGPDDDVEHAVDLMKRHGLRALPVVEDDTVLGTASMVDIAEAQAGVASTSLTAANMLKS